MKEELVKNILYQMSSKLDNELMEYLKMVLYMQMNNMEICIKETALSIYDGSAEGILKKYLAAKIVERKSEKTVKYYAGILRKFIYEVQKNIKDITTDDVRQYLYLYKKTKEISKVTMDNIRRVLSSFFVWLCKNRYITLNPMDLIEKIKQDQTIKECYSDEDIVKMRDNCSNLRDLAIVDFFNASMVRVGELVKLNIVDINFNERECIVFGKGSKEREVYIDAATKIHLMDYIQSRTDTNQALFVSLNAPHQRLTIGGIQDILRRLGAKTKINKVHPHRFRRTGATRQLDKGMPIEQVKELLGHTKIDTTMIYLNINKSVIKTMYQKLA